jgi:hypothetical protein
VSPSTLNPTECLTCLTLALALVARLSDMSGQAWPRMSWVGPSGQSFSGNSCPRPSEWAPNPEEEGTSCVVGRDRTSPRTRVSTGPCPAMGCRYPLPPWTGLSHMSLHPRNRVLQEREARPVSDEGQPGLKGREWGGIVEQWPNLLAFRIFYNLHSYWGSQGVFVYLHGIYQHLPYKKLKAWGHLVYAQGPQLTPGSTNTKIITGHPWFFFLGFELRASCLPGKCSTAWSMPLAQLSILKKNSF